MNNEFLEGLYSNLRNNCEKCFGFCCVALYFSKTEGFPTNKEGGKPCINLKEDFTCKIHKDLRKKGLKGCTSYDCFGAGGKVAQKTYNNISWREKSELSEEMFEAFLIMRGLHEMIWYLTEALRMEEDSSLRENLKAMIKNTEKLTELNKEELLKVDIIAHRKEVNTHLLKTSELIRKRVFKGGKSKFNNKKRIAGRITLIGADLKNTNLIGEDLSGALLIASDLRGLNLKGTDFMGADFRDTDIRGANLSKSIYLTQGQINSAKGDKSTKIPESLIIPSYWE